MNDLTIRWVMHCGCCRWVAPIGLTVTMAGVIVGLCACGAVGDVYVPFDATTSRDPRHIRAGAN